MNLHDPPCIRHATVGSRVLNPKAIQEVGLLDEENFGKGCCEGE